MHLRGHRRHLVESPPRRPPARSGLGQRGGGDVRLHHLAPADAKAQVRGVQPPIETPQAEAGQPQPHQQGRLEGRCHFLVDPLELVPHGELQRLAGAQPLVDPGQRRGQSLQQAFLIPVAARFHDAADHRGRRHHAAVFLYRENMILYVIAAPGPRRLCQRTMTKEAS